MRMAVCDGPGRLRVDSAPVPGLHGTHVLVRVSVCGICASDVAVWRGDWVRDYPCTLGHEFCGVIEETGADVTRLAAGQRVVINPNLGCGQCGFCSQGRPNLCDSLKTRPIKSNGGLAQYVALDHQMVYALPDAVVDELAPLVEPLSCASHACDTARCQPDERAMVFGGGVMGIMAVVVLRDRGVRVVVVEPDDWRRAFLAETLEVESLRPEEVDRPDLTGKVDAAIECSGNAKAAAQAVRTLRKAGTLVLAGLVGPGQAWPMPLMDMVQREITVKGAWLNPGDFSASIRLVHERREVLGRLRTSVFELESIEDAFQLAATGAVHKVLVKPSGRG